MTDEQLIDLSFKIDDLLYDFVNEKEIHPKKKNHCNWLV